MTSVRSGLGSGFLAFWAQHAQPGTLLIDLLGQIGELRLQLVDDLFLIVLLEEIGDSLESMFGQFVGYILALAFLKISLKTLLDFVESFLIVEKTLNFSCKLVRKNSLVVFAAHDLHVNGVVGVSDKAVRSFDLILGGVLGVLRGSLLLLCTGCILVDDLFILNLEMLQLRPLDLAIVDLYLADHASLLRKLLQGGIQVFHLG